MVRLKVNNEFLDLSEDAGFALSEQIANIGEIDTRKGASSTTFNIPLTNKNASILGYVNNLNYLTSNNPSKRYDAILYENGTLLKEGFLKISSYQNRTIRAVFFSGNSTWFDGLKNKKLTDLESLSDLDHIWNENNIIQTWGSSWTWEDGYCHPVISYGDKLTGNSFDVNQFPMAIYCKWLFQKIFEEEGYEVVGDFWYNDPDFNRLILPYSGVDYINEQGYVPRGDQARNYVYYNNSGELLGDAVAGGEAKITINPDVVNPFPYYNFTDEKLIVEDNIVLDISMNWHPVRNIGSYNSYIRDFDATYVYVDVYGEELNDYCGALSISVVNSEEQSYITNTYPAELVVSPAPDYAIYRINKADITYTLDAQSRIVFNQNIPPSDSSFDDRFKVEMYGVPTIRVNGFDYYGQVNDISLVPTDEVEFLIKNISPCGTTIDQNLTELVNLDIRVKSQETENTVFGSSSLPDMSQADFIKQMLIRHSAFIQFNTDLSQVEVLEFSRITDNLASAKDWTDKIDNTNSEILDFQNIVSNYGKKSIFLDVNDSNDTELSNFNQQTNTVFGQGEIEIDNDFIVDEKIILQTEFSPSISIDTELGFMPSINNVSDDDLNQRILYYQNGVTVGEISGFYPDITLNSFGGNETTADFSFSWYKLNNGAPPVISGNDLSFNDPSGLLVRYFDLLINVLDSPSSVTLDFNLKSTDILGIDLLRPIYLGGDLQSYFYINKISQYKGDGTTTKVELIKIA